MTGALTMTDKQNDKDYDVEARELIDFMRIAGFDYNKETHIWKRGYLELSGEVVAEWKKEGKLQDKVDEAIEDDKNKNDGMTKLKKMVNKAVLMKKAKENE